MRNSRGVTLIELLAVASVVGLVTMLGSRMIRESLSLTSRVFSKAQVSTEAKYALDMMQKAMRDRRLHSIGNAAGQPPRSSLTVYTVAGSTITFYQQNRELRVTRDGQDRVMLSNLRTLGFAQAWASVPNVDVTIVTSQRINATEETSYAVAQQTFRPDY